MPTKSEKFNTTIPAVPDSEIRSREKLKARCIGSELALVKICTHSSKKSLSSSTEVKVLSNPTTMAENQK